MKKIGFLISVLLLLAGCNFKNNELSYSKVELNSTKDEVLEFVKSVEGENGIHLFQYEDNTMYVFLNGNIVEQGSDARFFSDFKVNGKDDTLNIYYDEKFTNDYANKTLNNRELYKINLDKKYENVIPFKNNDETSFKVIYK